MCKDAKVEPQSHPPQSAFKGDVAAHDTMQLASELLFAANQMQEAAQQAMRAAEQARNMGARLHNSAAGSGPQQLGIVAIPKRRKRHMARPPLEPILEEMNSPAEFGIIRCLIADDRKTLVMQNLPLSYTEEMLVDLLDSEGFAGRYESAHMPNNYGRTTDCDCAVVRLMTDEDAECARAHFQDFNDWNSEELDAV